MGGNYGAKMAIILLFSVILHAKYNMNCKYGAI